MRMNPEFENQLAAKVQQELNTLGELSAPPSLAGRVLRAIEQRSAPPWYHCAWQSWPLALRGVSLVALLALFGGICLGVVELSHAAKVSPAGQHAGEWFAWLGVLWKTVGVLVDAAATAFRHLGMGIVIGCGLVLFATYAACIGLGTACVRLALAQR
jgi:hypothetical protein